EYQTHRKRKKQDYRCREEKVTIDADSHYKESDAGDNCDRSDDEPTIEPVAEQGSSVHQVCFHAGPDRLRCAGDRIDFSGIQLAVTAAPRRAADEPRVAIPRRT